MGHKGGTNDARVELDRKDMAKSECFKYLGPIIQKNDNKEQDVAYKIKREWHKIKSDHENFCEQNIPFKVETW